MKLSEMSLSDLLALKQVLMQEFQAHLTIGDVFKADIISDVKLPKVINAIRDIEESIIY